MPSPGPDIETIRQLAAESRIALGELRETLSTAKADRQTRLDQLGSEATALVEQLAAQIAGELSDDVVTQYDERSALARQELDAERESLHAQRDAWLAEQSEWEAVRTEIEAELSQREQQLAADLEASTDSDSSEADPVLMEKLEHARAEKEATEEKLTELNNHVAELTAALEEATEQLNAASELEAELETLRGKFDLAIADLQTHREHVATLEEELATRPEADASEPSELIQLRAEKDDLLQRLEELATAEPTVEPSEELADLRSRFSMAVEEVRELKTQNGELREQLVTASTSSVVSLSNDGNDWEAQKRRLMASLEEEGDSDDPDRQEERAKIEGTIQITDQVVAEKDREIHRLLESIQASTDEEASESAASNRADTALLDGDETIRAERERLAKLEAECQEKLRQAVLELSVERARNSRTEAELSEYQLELETLRAATGATPPGESKRKWLDKLGLGSDAK